MEKKYKLAVFDIDGTLIDTERTGVESLVKTIKELVGKDVPYEEAYKAYGIPSSKVGAMYGYADGQKFLERWEENFISLYTPITITSWGNKDMNKVTMTCTL